MGMASNSAAVMSASRPSSAGVICTDAVGSVMTPDATKGKAVAALKNVLRFIGPPGLCYGVAYAGNVAPRNELVPHGYLTQMKRLIHVKSTLCNAFLSHNDDNAQPLYGAQL